MTRSVKYLHPEKQNTAVYHKTTCDIDRTQTPKRRRSLLLLKMTNDDEFSLPKKEKKKRKRKKLSQLLTINLVEACSVDCFDDNLLTLCKLRERRRLERGY